MKKAKLPIIIQKEVSTFKTPQGDISLNRYRKVSLVCESKSNVKVGDRVKVFAGKKIPLGTEAVIKAVGRNKYENNPDNNPCLLLTIGENQDVWTTGKNCYKLGETGIEGKIRELDEIELCSLDLKKEGYVSDSPVWYFEGVPGESQIVEANVACSDYGLSIAKDASGKKLFKEVGDEYVMVLDDWRSDTYPFLVMKKEYKSGNCVIYKDFGTDRRFTDMNSPELTGFAQAYEAYKKYGEDKA